MFYHYASTLTLFLISYAHIQLIIHRWPFSKICSSLVIGLLAISVLVIQIAQKLKPNQTTNIDSNTFAAVRLGLITLNIILFWFCVLELPFDSDIGFDSPSANIWHLGFFDSVNTDRQLFFVLGRKLVAALFGHTILGNVIITSIISSLSVTLFFIAWRQLFGFMPAIIAVGLIVTNPWFVAATVIANSGATAFFSSSLGFLLLCKAWQLRSWRGQCLFGVAYGFFIFVGVWLYRATLPIYLSMVVAIAFLQLPIVKRKSSGVKFYWRIISICIGLFFAGTVFLVIYGGNTRLFFNEYMRAIRPDTRLVISRELAQERDYISHDKINVDIPIWNGSYFDEETKSDYSWQRTLPETLVMAQRLYAEMIYFCRNNAFPDHSVILFAAIIGVLQSVRIGAFAGLAFGLFSLAVSILPFLVTGDAHAIRRGISSTLFVSGFAGIGISGLLGLLPLNLRKSTVVGVLAATLFVSASFWVRWNVDLSEIKKEKQIGSLFMPCTTYSVRTLLKNANELTSGNKLVFVAYLHSARCLRNAVDTTEFKRAFPDSYFVEIGNAEEIPQLLTLNTDLIADCGSISALGPEKKVCELLSSQFTEAKVIESAGDHTPYDYKKHRFVRFHKE